jgi:3-oxoacyl-ACP reductase-like protein
MDSATPRQMEQNGATAQFSGDPVLKIASNAPLAEQVAVITGAGRGIGAAIADCLADLGAQTVLCGRSRPPLDAVVSSKSTFS